MTQLQIKKFITKKKHQSCSHLVFHKVIEDGAVQLPNVFGNDGQIGTLHLDLRLASPCCRVLLFPRCTVLDLETRKHNAAFNILSLNNFYKA